MALVIEDPHFPAPDFPMIPRNLSEVTDIIVHHSAGPLTQTPASIDSEHRAIGDAECGYNYIITPDGKVWEGRPLTVVPAAAYGRNAQSIDICVIGQFEDFDAGYTGPPKALQMDALEALVLMLHQHYPHIIRTIGHRDVATMFYPSDQSDYATACPGNDLYPQLAALRARVSRSMNVR